MNRTGLASIFGLLLLVGSIAEAQTWYTGKQHTVAWDAVTETIEGGSIPSEELTYEVFVSYPTAIDPTGKWDPTLVSLEVAGLEYTFILPRGGRVYAGVRAVRLRLAEVHRSEIAWSDTAEYVGVGGTFGLFWLLQSTVTGGAWTSGVKLQ